MIDHLSSAWGEVGWSVTWQTGLALAAGLLAAATCARRPARADGLLVAAVVAALTMPVGTFAVRRLGWGMLAPHHPSTAPRSFSTTYPSNLAMPPAPSGKSDVSGAPTIDAPGTAPVRVSAEPIAADTLSPFALRTDVLSSGDVKLNTSRPAPWRSWVPPILSTAWVALSAAALLRLAGAVWSARRLLATSRRLHDAWIDRALTSAAERLKLNVTCEARVSAEVRCPVIWCWSRRPVVLLPAEFVRSSDESAWPAIFCHELAHRKRRDHFSSLAIDVLCCVVPWQPLAWWVSRRHAQLSEQACDEWVLACGQPAESYADSLLNLTPQRGARLALAVLRNRGGLAGRVKHILDIVHAQPALGRSWMIGLAVCTLCFVAFAALAQQKPITAGKERAAAANSTTARATKPDSPKERLQHVSGVVLDVSNKPVAGARVYWVGYFVGPDERQEELQLLAQGVTDGQGRFSISANFGPEGYRFHSVLVRLEGHGMGLETYQLTEQTKPLEILLPDPTPLRGRILDPNGMPVGEAVVLPVHLENDSSLPLPDRDWRSELPTFWPKAVKTDADGRFTIPGTDNPGGAMLRIAAAGFGLHAALVPAQWSKRQPPRDESTPMENDFTLVLEPPRTIQGTFTDAQTGRPVAGVEIVLETSGYVGNQWHRQVTRATSDERGHYRFFAPATGHEQHLLIHPPLGYAPLGARIYLERQFTELFGNGRVYENNVQLKRGRIVRGRVIEADSQEPVVDAAVLYSSPNVERGDYWLREPVLTDDGGEFKLTAVGGPGMITVDTRSRDHLRTTMPPDATGAGLDVNPHAYAAIDVPAESKIPPLELAVHRGVDLIVEPVGPDGQPVPSVQIACREADVPATHSLRSSIMEAPLRLRGCGAGKTYRLLIVTRSCDLGAVTEVVCDPAKGPVKVRLQATGRLRGRLAFADGTPAGEIQTFLRFRDDPPPILDAKASADARRAAALIEQNLPYYNNVMPLIHKDNRLTTDADGAFEFQGIVPGVYLYLMAAGERYQAAGMIEAGKTLDIGQLTIKPSP